MESQYEKQEAYDYFSDESFSRLFAAARRKYESLGRVGGTIRLVHLRMNERTKLSGLLSRSLMRQNSITVRLQELEEVLLSSRFETDLQSLLSLLYGEVIKSKMAQTVEAEEAWKHFVDKLCEFAVETETNHWLRGLYQAEAYGYRTFRELFEQVQGDPQHCDGLEAGISAVIRAVDGLPVRNGDFQMLAVFAAVQCGDPHFFDRDQLWGRLFYCGILSYLSYRGMRITADQPLSNEIGDGREDPIEESEKATSSLVRKQYEKVGIRLDSLSSQVLVMDVDAHLQVNSYWITLDSLERFQQRSQMQGLPTEELETEMYDSMTAFIKRVILAGKVFVNENPSVCESLMNHLTQKDTIDPNDHPTPLICTSGQPSVAALTLLDLFAVRGVEIYYSGDLDVKGLEMAITLHRRYPSLWHPWGMTTDIIQDILKANEPPQTGVYFTGEERTRLQRLTCPWDPQIIDELLDGGRKIYQEMLMPVLLEEYLRNGRNDDSF